MALRRDCNEKFLRGIAEVTVLSAASPAIPKDAIYWLEWQLQNWAKWMRGDESPEGLPAEACGGMLTGYTHMGDSDAAYDKMDVTLAEATNAAIEGLEAVQQVAVYAAYGVAKVWRFGRQTDVLLHAKANIMDSLRRRGIWLGD